MNERDGYGFCPRCGALMQEGVCRSCGYAAGNGQQGAYGNQNGAGWQGSYGGQPGMPQGSFGGRNGNWQQKPEKKKKAGGRAVAVICAAVGILFLVGIVVFMVISIRKVVDEVERGGFPGYGYGSDDGYFGYGEPYTDSGDSYDDSYDSYEPSEKDDYYVEITDATSLDLSYQVIWGSLSLRPDDEENDCTYDCIYPVLTGEGEEEKFSAMNQVLEDLVCRYKGDYQDYESGISSYGYVTCMDEEKISVVVKHSFYEKRTTTPRVEAITLRMDTGEVITHEEMAEVDEELAWQFRSRNSHQNGTVEFVDGLTDEELMEYLSNEEDSVMFYTPVGLEVGFNYDGGWVTVTLKTNTL